MQFSLCNVSVLVFLMCTACGAEARGPQPLFHWLPGDPQRATIAAGTRARDLAERARAVRAIDVTPPVLKKFRITGGVDAQRASQAAEAAISLTDDLAGIVSYDIRMLSPSGILFFGTQQNIAAPQRAYSQKVTVDGAYQPAFSKYSEPGTWRIASLSASDANGNTASYTQDQLAALGNIEFTVVNDGGYDATPPHLAKGTITTPLLSLSKAPKGTPAGTLPFAAIELKIEDEGNGAVSGAKEVLVAFCKRNGAGGCEDYLYLSGNTARAGQRHAVVLVGGALDRASPGVYEISQINMGDTAGNVRSLYNSVFGGADDFSEWFSSTIMTVTP